MTRPALCFTCSAPLPSSFSANASASTSFQSRLSRQRVPLRPSASLGAFASLENPTTPSSTQNTGADVDVVLSDIVNSANDDAIGACGIEDAEYIEPQPSLGNGTAGTKAKNIDVVITHTGADFDSLAAAVGLAKLRGPKTAIVTPGGENPALRRFLALHRQLFEIVDPKTIDCERLRWVGVVDTVRKERLGMAANWPALADEVCVFDHHIGRVCDIDNEQITVVVEPVGAVCTLIVERLREAKLVLTPAEATLLALAIHSDTGNLTYEHTTPRDAVALAWCMENGAIQRSIAEFSLSLLTDDQQQMLAQGLADIRRKRIHGVEIGSVVLKGRQFLKGMSTVASDLLDLANVDVLLLAYVNCRGRKARRKTKKPAMDDGAFCGPEQLRQVSVIGRAKARVDGINFNKLFAPLGGGGHERAASAALKLTEEQAEEMMERLVEVTSQQIPEPSTVVDHMTKNVHTVLPNTSMYLARKRMEEEGKKGLPVIDEYGVLQGMVTMREMRLAEYKGGEKAMKNPVSGFMHTNVVSVAPNTPFYEASALIAENSIGRLPVVDDKDRLIGLVTRTDVLVAQRMWSDNVNAE